MFYNLQALKIQLTKGKEAIIDGIDYAAISKHKWYAFKSKRMWYAATNINKRPVSMHRFIMNVLDSKIFVDHKDHDGLNNKRDNLRLCSLSQNHCNRRSAHNKKYSKYLGVYWDNSKMKWTAKLRKDKLLYSLGTFKLENDAAIAYNNAAVKHHGEFANLNIIN